MRPTGCPEEEVSAELYASIQGQGGAQQGGSHHAFSLSVSSRVCLERKGCLPNPRRHDLSVLFHRLGIYIYPFNTNGEFTHKEKTEAKKLESNLKTQSVWRFFSFSFEVLVSRKRCPVAKGKGKCCTVVYSATCHRTQAV